VENPDTGSVYNLNGSGTLANQDAVTLTGSLHGTGFVKGGHATGELTITGAHGSVTLDLSGPTQGAFAPLPRQFSFTVKSGTGDYLHLHASGMIILHLDSQDGTFTLAILGD
jgi:hypothetical protein